MRDAVQSDFEKLNQQHFGRMLLFPIVLSALLISISFYNFLLFHTLAELFAIAVSVIMLSVAWQTYSFSRNAFLMFLACGYFWVGMMDLTHALVYKGMNIFPDTDANPPTQLWIAARYSQVLILLTAPVFLGRELNYKSLFIAFGAIAFTFQVMIFKGWFPDAFIEGSGLTDFKIVSEYIIIILLAAALFHMAHNKTDIGGKAYGWMAASIILTMGAELSFTFYVDVYGLSIIVGHIFKLLSFWLIFIAIVRVSLREPYLNLERKVADRTQHLSTEIIDHEVTEHALEETRKNLANAQRIAKLGSWEWDVEKDEHTWSDEIYRLFGKRSGEMEANYEAFLEMVHPDDKDMVDRAVKRAFVSNNPYTIEHRIILADNSQKTVQEQGETTFDHDGNAIKMSGTVQDISELKRQEESFRQSRELFKRAFRSNPGLIALTHPDTGVHVDVNESWLNALKFTREEVVGKTGFEMDLWADMTERDAIIDEQNKKGRVRDFVAQLKAKDGTLIDCSISTEPIKMDHQELMLWTANDVTKSKSFERQLILARDEAENASRAKSDFLASMSHELRTPLNAVLGFAQLLQIAPKNTLTKDQNEYVENILDGGSHLLTLVNEILDLARIEADQLDLSLKKVEINSIISDCVAMTEPLGKSREITIMDNFSDGASVQVRTDPIRLKQVLLNLLSNAIKFNELGGSVVVDGRETEEQYLRLSVTDTGSGIAEEDKASVFVLFHRLNADPMVAREGSGIGLTVTKHLMERMGGHIGFDSEVGVGSTFWIELPLMSNKDVLIWTDKLRVNVDAIDKDHQVIVALTNKVSQKNLSEVELEGVIKELSDYTRYHFQREEAIMEACGYPKLEEHRRLHEELSGEVQKFIDDWHLNRHQESLRNLQGVLREWLIVHVMKNDAEIFQYAAGRESDIRKTLENLK